MQLKKITIPIMTLLALFLLGSCKDEQNNSAETPESQKDSTLFSTAEKIKNDAFDFAAEENKTLKKWGNYYRAMDDHFDLKKFEFQSSAELNLSKGSIPGKFDKRYDSIYNSFLIFNPDKSEYIDIDSYHWQLNEEGEVMFNPDQEINLVNLKDSTVQRIAFRGPSFTVEDAFWKTPEKIILLEGTYENSPNISLIDVKEKKIYSYAYPDTLPGKSNYKNSRIQAGLR